jgi:hypothetical protein
MYNVFSADLPAHVLGQGMNELITMASNILNQFILSQEETLERILGSPARSNLRWIARVDIGILHDQNSGKVSYWVTDIKQCHCTPLYTQMAGESAKPLATSMVHLMESIVMQQATTPG